MSDITEQYEISDQSPYATRVDALLDRFSALVEHAQALAFPPLRKGVTAPPDMTGWSRLRRIAFTISSPWPTTFTMGSNYADVMLTVWGLVSLYWYLAADMLFDRIFGTLTLPAYKPDQPIWVEIVAYVILAVVMALIPSAYWCWIEFFRDQRYSRSCRVILTIVFVGIVISSPYWLLAPEYRAQFPDLLLGDLYLTFLFVVTYLLFVIPQGTFYYRVAIDVLVLSVRLLWGMREYLRSIYSPLPKELVRKLALEPIPISGNGGKTWRLAELTRGELKSLRKWAATNREGTDKRLLPTAILFGALGVFANTRAFSDAIDRGLTWLYNCFIILVGAEAGMSSLATTGRLVVAMAVVALGMVFIGAMLSLFRNLVVQSLIIEACIVAEYACEQRQSLGSRTETATAHKSFWERLLGLFCKR